jgi:transcriptional regulator with XRE-family HTH domain
VDPFDLPGILRRIRRLADLSQRELADVCGLSQSAVAQAESGRRDLPTGALARAAACAGLRIALVDGDGHQIHGMSPDSVLDLSGRRFPAHLDTHHSDERWWRFEHRFHRPRPWFTFDRDRAGRDSWRQETGTPDDHLSPGPCDSPQERRAQRVRDARRRETEDRRRRLLAGEFATLDVGFRCTCPGRCDELDDRSGKPIHAEGCPCLCDLA